MWVWKWVSKYHPQTLSLLHTVNVYLSNESQTASEALDAGGGAATAACGGCSFLIAAGVAAGTGAITGATNNIIAQTGNGVCLSGVNWGQVGMSAGVGSVLGIAGFGAANLPLTLAG